MVLHEKLGLNMPKPSIGPIISKKDKQESDTILNPLNKICLLKTIYYWMFHSSLWKITMQSVLDAPLEDASSALRSLELTVPLSFQSYGKVVKVAVGFPWG